MDETVRMRERERERLTTNDGEKETKKRITIDAHKIFLRRQEAERTNVRACAQHRVTTTTLVARVMAMATFVQDSRCARNLAQVSRTTMVAVMTTRCWHMMLHKTSIKP